MTSEAFGFDKAVERPRHESSSSDGTVTTCDLVEEVTAEDLVRHLEPTII